MGRIEGKIAVITGGGSGFGRATAIRFVQEGARVVVADVNKVGAEETVRLAGGECRAVVGDIATAAGAAQAIKTAVDAWGGLDVLVNNAGIADARAGDTWNVDEEMWDRIVRVNLKSVYLCSRAAIPLMLARGAGSIVSLSSIAATAPVGGAAYAATKGGILSYTRLVARELAAKQVRVNCVSPGHMVTPMSLGLHEGASPQQQDARRAMLAKRTPMGHAGEADDIANAILYLASDEAKFVTGQEIVVDGGYLVR